MSENGWIVVSGFIFMFMVEGLLEYRRLKKADRVALSLESEPLRKAYCDAIDKWQAASKANQELTRILEQPRWVMEIDHNSIRIGHPEGVAHVVIDRLEGPNDLKVEKCKCCGKGIGGRCSACHCMMNRIKHDTAEGILTEYGACSDTEQKQEGHVWTKLKQEQRDAASAIGRSCAEMLKQQAHLGADQQRHEGNKRGKA